LIGGNINTRMEYKIISFDEDRGSVVISYGADARSRMSIDLPIDGDRYLEEEDLEIYIRGFIPTWVSAREEIVKNVKNADYIRGLVCSEEAKKDLTLLSKHKIYRLLSDSDWTQLKDCYLTEESQQEWTSYRKQLRDLIYDPNWPDIKDWPVEPRKQSLEDFKEC
jgi:hypothetical protein